MSAKRARFTYSEFDLANALAAIRGNRMTARQASRTYGVPRSSLQDRIKGRVRDQIQMRAGPDPVLSILEEKTLVDWCVQLLKCGFPLKVNNLLDTVQKIMKKNNRKNPFKNDRPGRKWYAGFLRRHPEIAERTPKGLIRGNSVISKEKWFFQLKKCLRDLKAETILTDPKRMFYSDEMSFSICPTGGTVTGIKEWTNVSNSQTIKMKDIFTVLLSFSANGETGHPMLAFSYKSLPLDILNSVSTDWIIGRSDTGYIRAETFFEYIVADFHKWLKEQNIIRPVLLFIDGSKSHLSTPISEFCSNNDIILYALPPMKQKDSELCRPLQIEWTKTVNEWKSISENKNCAVTKFNFCTLLKTVFESISLADTIRNEFLNSGLFPLKCRKDIQTELHNTTIMSASDVEPKDNAFNVESFDIAKLVIEGLSSHLACKGIDSHIVIEEIENAKAGFIEISNTSEEAKYILPTFDDCFEHCSAENAENSSISILNKIFPEHITEFQDPDIRCSTVILDCKKSLPSLASSFKKGKSNNIGNIKSRKNLKRSRKGKSKEKQFCYNCEDVLISDVEDDLLKNIGCDNCYRWYHVKCTKFATLSYAEAAKQEFKCDSC